MGERVRIESVHALRRALGLHVREVVLQEFDDIRRERALDSYRH
jgi:hypothetical protein